MYNMSSIGGSMIFSRLERSILQLFGYRMTHPYMTFWFLFIVIYAIMQHRVCH